MEISKRLSAYLAEKKYKVDIIEHRTTYTAWDTSQTEKVEPKEVGKSLVIKADNDYILALIPANKNLDKKKLLKIINVDRKKKGEKNCKKIDFAKEVWMKKNIPGKVGATAPFGDFLKLEIFMDKLLEKNKKIYVGSGEYEMSLRINISQYLKNENPKRESFSMAKK
ncbi:MAG: hypothetical protein COU40_01610 [Candidatus Moranbacteria bacterium CG10_big_fil_rev_8_21_14_0_10_35_21]|nr:MAG: hypothetical protein COU40_01610 [Candidatus Moranbacteria bacterium CG10_big_fil_rev_8_21_14_0_10_35_21]PJA88623.1 MAG: hypothetical protein CO139_02170 [Candidatus Moranbacteria bacterium CG_4_9_14_3_um_filter_36_9]